MLNVSELFIYPIKSLGGISVPSAVVTDRGFKYDRRWMLVDSDNRFLTQREFAEMALLQVQFGDAGLIVHHKKRPTDRVLIPYSTENSEVASVEVWGDTCKAVFVGTETDQWFSDMLSFTCRLVYMPDSTKRRVDTRYATNKEITSLSDGYPFLLIGQSSLDDLNNRLAIPLPMNRFRPNIVFTGGNPHEEDSMQEFSIGDIRFFGVKLCARCPITTTNQDTAERSKEPLKTLATYRQKNNRIYFGQNLLHDGQGQIQVGDVITIRKSKIQRIQS